jgi:hypothetical protein
VSSRRPGLDDPRRFFLGCLNAVVLVAVVFLLVFLLVWAVAR